LEIQAAGKRRILMRVFFRIFLSKVVKPLLGIYLKKNRQTRVGTFSILVYDGVFHPQFFFSTKYFFEFLSLQEIKSQKALEIGSGTGILSLLAYQMGAETTAIDVDVNAVRNTEINFENTFGKQHQAKIYQSNLFENVPNQKFDLILINPPYFFKKIIDPKEFAWHCGEDGEYFERLFAGISAYIHNNSKIYMVLAENCDIKRIERMAYKNDLVLIKKHEKKIYWERNFIFLIENKI